LLSSSSQRLVSLSPQLQIRRVIFHLPASWSHAPCSALATSGPAPTSQDLEVGLHPLARPQVEQYGGCGTRGRAVLMPYSMLFKNVTAQIGKKSINNILRSRSRKYSCIIWLVPEPGSKLFINLCIFR
jgi:hypothetical protein